MGAVDLTAACSTRAGAPFSSRWVHWFLSLLYFFLFFSNPFLNISHFIKHWTFLSRFFFQTYIRFSVSFCFIKNSIQFVRRFSFLPNIFVSFLPSFKIKKKYLILQLKVRAVQIIMFNRIIGISFSLLNHRSFLFKRKIKMEIKWNISSSATYMQLYATLWWNVYQCWFKWVL